MGCDDFLARQILVSQDENGLPPLGKRLDDFLEDPVNKLSFGNLENLKDIAESFCVGASYEAILGRIDFRERLRQALVIVSQTQVSVDDINDNILLSFLQEDFRDLLAEVLGYCEMSYCETRIQ